MTAQQTAASVPFGNAVPANPGPDDFVPPVLADVNVRFNNWLVVADLVAAPGYVTDIEPSHHSVARSPSTIPRIVAQLRPHV